MRQTYLYRMREFYHALMEQTGAIATVPVRALIELAEGLPKRVPLKEMLRNVNQWYARQSGIAMEHYANAKDPHRGEE